MQTLQCLDFTLQGYRYLLEAAKTEGYEFLSFHTQEKDLEQKVCLFRHDISADLGSVYELAKVVAEYGIKATYFLMIRSPMYSLFGRGNHRLVNEIIHMGHDICLHYDDYFSLELGSEINRQVRIEASMLESMFEIDWEEMDVWQIYNAVRAQTHPYPGAFGLINNKKVKIWKCRVFDTRLSYSNTHYGDRVEIFDDRWIIACRGGLLLLDEFEIV